MFLKAKEMVKYDLVAYLEIPEIISLSRVCRDINSVIDLNRHNIKTQGDRDILMIDELMKQIVDFDKLENDGVLVTEDFKK